MWCKEINVCPVPEALCAPVFRRENEKPICVTTLLQVLDTEPPVTVDYLQKQGPHKCCGNGSLSSDLTSVHQEHSWGRPMSLLSVNFDRGEGQALGFSTTRLSISQGDYQPSPS